MTRQEIAIKIAKITRIIGEWKYRLDLDDEVEIETLSPDLLHIDEWAREIGLYIKQNPSPILVRQITNIGFTDLLETYVQEHKQEIEEPFVWALNNYVKHMRALLSFCDEQSIEERGPYRDLIAPLANEQVAALLQRAVDAGILDCHYQPVPGTKVLQLKVIAFAVSSICGFPRAYMHFEKLWKRDHGSRIGTCRAPKCHTEYYEAVKALYPEVNFSTFEPEHTKAATFYAPQREDDKRDMYQTLIRYGYIAPETTWETFSGIFDTGRFRRPVEWLKGQRQLAYFVHSAFHRFNKRELWIKGEYCFRINGNVPHRASFVTGYSWLKRVGWIDKYDVKLKEICNKFNHIEESTTIKETKHERLIHTSKCVFYTTKGDKEKRKLYSSLVKKDYIAPETTFSMFKGIFDEAEFKGPIQWTKSQAQLMYFVHLAFKTDNPFDVWVKCVHCFRFPNGTQPNRESMNSNFRLIKKRGLLDTFDIELKRIADNYTCVKMIETNAPDQTGRSYSKI